ncbi:MAG TPA: S53 family peptidase [Thermoanaerobaculia bacterium]|jgi:kumamolisin|nr:S53 family peptidase [Thermoanaerobaculia bacterium]
MAERKVFVDSVTPLPKEQEGLGLVHDGLMINAAAAEHKDAKMTVLFSLAISPAAQQELEDRVARGEVVSPEELQGKYAASSTDKDALVTWLRGQGFEITHETPDATSVYARAPIDQIEKSLGVDMVRVTKEGITYTAARNPPSLPAEVAKSVHAIIGLQPFRQARKNSRRCAPAGNNRAGLVRPAQPEGSALTAAAATPNVQNAPPYLVSEVLKAYGADALGVSGNGQTIAILIDTFPNNADVKAFWKANQIAGTISRVQKVNVRNVNLPPPTGEESLDVEWASGIAPGAKVRVYASGSLRFVDLDLALDRILADLPTRPGMRQLSISLGLGETFMGGPNGEVATQHAKFLRLAAAGVNVFVSSGDAGSNPDDTGQSPTGPTQVEYESSDPSVIGVGGTTLKLAANGTVTSETAWTNSGGGKSIFFSRPSWQKGAGIPPGTERLVPDVSLAADPNTGALVVLGGTVQQIGGTSWSAPVWAGFCALMNEARVQASKPMLPFLNPLLYPLIGTPSFRDIKNGSNGAFAAGAGHDLVTGIGVPNVKQLIAALP